MDADLYPVPMGRLSARIVGAERQLRQLASQALDRAAAQPDQDGQFAASLRGKAKGYHEAADAIRAISKGQALPRPHGVRKHNAAA